MHWEKKLALSLDASMPLGSIPGASVSASPASQEQRCVTAHRGSSTSTAERQTVSKDELAQLNKNIELVGEILCLKEHSNIKLKVSGKKSVQVLQSAVVQMRVALSLPIWGGRPCCAY